MLTAGAGDLEHYELQGVIGQGGAGVVHRALDRRTGRTVALKTLRKVSPRDLYRLKREFRVVSGLSHPNLVEILELVVEGERCFFTMELVDGPDLLTWVRGSGARPGTALDAAGVARLQHAIGQLASALAALHGAGRLHRDVKPSNIRVDPEGRVVLLDFGLATAIAQSGPDSTEDPVAGTAAYMAPELVWGKVPSPASDIYSLGVLVYELLSGRPPFEGAFMPMMLAKTRERPPPLEQVAPGTSEEHAALAIRMLSPRPEDRPAAADIAALFGAAGAPEQPLAWAVEPADEPGAAGHALVGRARELKVLAEALEAVQGGRPVTVHVAGPAGIGKTHLVDHFVRDARAQHDALVLRGRCFVYESVPFPGVDGLVDSLSHFLARADEATAAACVPRHVGALLRLFPVLARIDILARAAQGTHEPAEPRELRRRAFYALGDLLARVAERHLLVLWIDDLQWGDADSASFLTDLMRGREMPPVLLIAAYRNDEQSRSALPRALLAGSPGTEPVMSRRSLTLTPLAEPDAAALVQSIGPELDEATVWRVVREAGGSPFLGVQLARHAVVGGAEAAAHHLSLEALLTERLRALKPEARSLMEVVAVAGVPIALERAAGAARLPDAFAPARALMRDGRLLKAAPLSGEGRLEVYHDRIREGLLAMLGDARRVDWHRRLAETYERESEPEPLELIRHWRGAGEPERAARHVLAAADRAAVSMAFAHAARLYGLALESPGRAWAAERPEWRVRSEFARALANSGRGGDAAEAYAAAARSADAGEEPESRVIGLRRAAAEQFLRSGHVEAGYRLLRESLSAVDLPYPASQRRALAGVLAGRARMSLLRPTALEPSAEAPTAGYACERIDVLWTGTIGLVWVDNLRSSYFQALHAREAFALREPSRLAQALASESTYLAVEGASSSRRRSAEAAARALELADAVGEPNLRALAQVCAGSAAFLRGDWREAWQRCETAEQLIESECVGAEWERTNSHLFGQWALGFLGAVGTLGTRVPPLIRDARDRGDLLSATAMRVGFPNLRWLAADRPDAALQRTAEAMAQWRTVGYSPMHFFAMVGQIQADLYRGDPETAWGRARGDEDRVGTALLLRNQVIRGLYHHMRASAAISLAARRPGRRPALLRAASRASRKLLRESAPWCHGLGHLAAAGVARVRGRLDDAVAALVEAEKGLDATGMGLYHAAVCAHLGELLGGDEGAALCARAEAWMQEEGVVSPARMSRAVAPLPVDVREGVR